MKTVFISDLDGTLLNSEACVSSNSEKILNQAIELGINFSVATARTPATALKILQNINLNVPIAMMNGVLVFDTVEQCYLQVNSMDKELAGIILAVIKANDLACFMYGMNDGELKTYYDSVDSRSLNKFRNERIMKYDKKFTEVEDLSLVTGKKIIYFTLREEKQKLDILYNQLKYIKGITVAYYEDVYNKEWWLLEIYSEKASKQAAVKYISQNGEYERVIGFGDNLNDLPMFDACDLCYAVENANSEVKDRANDIILGNDYDGVALFIKNIISNCI